MLKAHTKKWQNKKQERCALIGRAACQRERDRDRERERSRGVCMYVATAVVKIYPTIDKKRGV